MEAHSLDDKAGLDRRQDQVHRLPGRGAELRGELDHRAGVGHLQAQGQARVRRVFPDLADFVDVVVGHEGLVGVELAQRLVGLDRIGVDDLVPDPVLPLRSGQALDVPVDDAKLRQRSDVEARARVEEGLDDLRQRPGLDRVVGLHAGQVLFEHGVVAPDLLVVDHEEGRPVPGGEILELSA